MIRKSNDRIVAPTNKTKSYLDIYIFDIFDICILYLLCFSYVEAQRILLSGFFSVRVQRMGFYDWINMAFPTFVPDTPLVFGKETPDDEGCDMEGKEVAGFLYGCFLK